MHECSHENTENPIHKRSPGCGRLLPDDILKKGKQSRRDLWTFPWVVLSQHELIDIKTPNIDPVQLI